MLSVGSVCSVYVQQDIEGTSPLGIEWDPRSPALIVCLSSEDDQRLLPR